MKKNFPCPESISVIIPTLNEEDTIQRCLQFLHPENTTEVIICDGGSTDHTCALIEKHQNIQLVTSPPGRAIQMNHAASLASGDILLFLHADTMLPPDGLKKIRQSIQAGYSMGCFERKFEPSNWLLNLTSRLAGWRARKFFLAYGDQAIFIRRDLFQQLGGYRNLTQFEDIDLTRRARHQKSWTVLPDPIVSDARRFQPSPLIRIIKDAILTAFWLARQKK